MHAEMGKANLQYPPFLLAMLIAARRTGDEMLEDLAQECLAESGINVFFCSDKEHLAPRKHTDTFASGDLP